MNLNRLIKGGPLLLLAGVLLFLSIAGALIPPVAAAPLQHQHSLAASATTLTFARTDYPIAPASQPYNIVVGDFNRDGKLDIVSINFTDS